MDKLCFCLYICEKLDACPRVSMEESFEFHLQNAAHWMIQFDRKESREQTKRTKRTHLKNISVLTVKYRWPYLFQLHVQRLIKGWLSRVKISAWCTGQKNAIMAPEFLPHYTVPSVFVSKYIYRLPSDVTEHFRLKYSQFLKMFLKTLTEGVTVKIEWSVWIQEALQSNQVKRSRR